MHQVMCDGDPLESILNLYVWHGFSGWWCKLDDHEAQIHHLHKISLHWVLLTWDNDCGMRSWTLQYNQTSRNKVHTIHGLLLQHLRFLLRSKNLISQQGLRSLWPKASHSNDDLRVILNKLWEVPNSVDEELKDAQDTATPGWSVVSCHSMWWGDTYLWNFTRIPKILMVDLGLLKSPDMFLGLFCLILQRDTASIASTQTV